MAFPILAAVMAGGTALKGGIGAFQKDQQRQALLSAQRAEVRQRNKLSRIQDQQLFGEYLRSVKAETEAYELRKESAARQISLNNSAYQRTIETGLTSLADLSDNFIAKAQSRKIKLARSTGAAAASGMTGVTAERADTMQIAAAKRPEAMEEASKERAVGQYIFNTNLAKEQVEQANWRAYASVAIPPTFGPPPVSSGMIQRPKDQTGSALMADIAGVAIDSAMSFVGNLPKQATIPSPKTGLQGNADSYLQEIMNENYTADQLPLPVLPGDVIPGNRGSLSISSPASPFVGDLPVSMQLLDGVL